MKFKHFAAILGVLVIGYGIFWIIQYFRSQWIEPGHIGLIFNANSGLERKIYKPQRLVPGLRETIYTYPTMIKAAIYTQDPDFGETRAADGIQVTTSDNASTTFDMVVFYKVKSEDVFKVYDSFGALDISQIQSQHIRRALREAANVAGPRFDVFQLMGEKRKEASQIATAEMQRILAPKGITVYSVLFGTAYPDQNVTAKITQRVNALTELQISKTRRDIAELGRQIAQVKNQAEAQAQKLAAAQTSGKSLSFLAIEANKAAIAKWNGQLPFINIKQGQTVIVDRGLLDMLKQESDKAQAK